MAIVIDDPADPRIAAYRFVRERDLVGRQGLFVAEGEVVVRVLLTRSLHPVETLLIAEKRLPALADLIALVPATVPVYSVRQAVMDEIAGFPMHRGILAIGRRRPMIAAREALTALAATSIVVVLLGVANHDNVGGIFRNAAAFGADAVFLDGDCCDPLYRKAIRVSVGAVLAVPFAFFQRGEDPLDLLASHGFATVALSPHGSLPLDELRATPRLAVLLGTEGEGLPPAILARARTVRIPMSGRMDSLNVATASGIVLHHLAEARNIAR